MRKQLWQDLLLNLVRDQVPFRPSRTEPRAVKRRPKPYPLLNKRKRLSNPMGGDDEAGEPTGLGKLRSPLGLPSYWAKFGYLGSRPLGDFR